MGQARPVVVTSRTGDKGRRTRQRIVVAASELMTSHGVGATRLSDVQDAAGVGPSQIYHYFANKAELVRTVITHRDDTVVGSQQTALGAIRTIDDLRDRADRVADQQDRLGCRGGCPIGSLTSELAEVDEQARDQLGTAFDRWSQAVRDGVGRLHARGVLRADVDTDALATTLLAAAQGGLLLGQAQRSTVPLRTALHTVIDLLEQACVNRAG